jgi:hypothetical protein
MVPGIDWYGSSTTGPLPTESGQDPGRHRAGGLSEPRWHIDGAEYVAPGQLELELARISTHIW